MRENTEVPVPPQDQSKPGNGLPNPDLNPMMNPTLGQNLGLWAQVYFTNPPEKREEAVQQLLRDLENGTKPAAVRVSAPQSEIAAKPEEKPAQVAQDPVAREDILCPACLHRNDAKQRFCGLCGFTLQSKKIAEALPVPPPPVATTVPAEVVERNPNDWQWLHQKNLVELQTSKRRTTPWRLFILVAGVLILAIIGYLLWTRSAKGASQAGPPSLNSGNPALVARKAEPAQSQQQSSSPAREAKGSGQAEPTNSPPQSEKESSPSIADDAEKQAPGEPVASAESGRKELEMAHRYLDGTAFSRNDEAAAFWLWKAVKKDNEEAVLLLSELYVKGEGVPQSCDQARVLLSAAAKRGSSAAGGKLKEINSACR